jgi:lipid-binding SYLF domain-containing protein
MRNRSLQRLVIACCLMLATSAVGLGQDMGSKKPKDDTRQSEKAARVFREIMDTPDKAIPQDLLDGAQCVAVFPEVIKAGFIVGGRGGRGVASCRTANGWSAPAFFDLKGGSFGLQIGVQATDFVLLFMNDRGLNGLLADKFELGGEASVAAGPVGREAGASTDAKLGAEILSYSRSKGVFAGLELKGVVISADKKDMREAYGKGITAKEVLRDNQVTAPTSVQDFPNTLIQYSSRQAQK